MAVRNYLLIVLQKISGFLNHQTFRTGSPLLEFADCFAIACCCARAARPAADFSNCSCLQFQLTRTDWSTVTLLMQSLTHKRALFQYYNVFCCFITHPISKSIPYSIIYLLTAVNFAPLLLKEKKKKSLPPILYYDFHKYFRKFSSST